MNFELNTMMHGLEIIFDIVVLITITILIFVAKNLLPSYFKEKGKNLATKEDIGEITTEVENVKSIFLKEIEKLRNKLLYQNSINIAIFSESIEIIKEYIICLHAWKNHVMDSCNYDRDNSMYLNKELHEEGILSSKCSLSEAKLVLFVQDEDIIGLVNEIRVFILERFVPNKRDHVFKVCKLYIELDSPEISKEESGKIFDELKESYDVFNNNVIKHFTDLAPLLHKLNELLIIYMRKEIKEE